MGRAPVILAYQLASNAFLGVAALRVWHALLVKEWLERPFVLLAWLAGIFVLVVVNRALATSVPAAQRGAVDRLWARIDGPRLLLIAFFLCLVFVFNWGFERAASDGREYFVQVRSLVIDGDLDFRNENETFGVRGTANTYAFGAPLLWAPFFIICHVWLKVMNVFGGSHPIDGFANPYQRAIGLGTLVYGFAAVVLICEILREYFSKWLAVATSLVLCGGSFLIWYLTVENSMVHGASMFATTLFLFVWHRTRSSRTPQQWAWLGASAGLMSMVRWQDALFFIIPVAHGLRQSTRTARVPRRAGRLVNDAALFGAGLLAGFAPQLVFWKIVRGAWLSPPTEEHGFNIASLHVGDVLFSPNHGLLSWSPLIYLAILGLPLFFRRDRVLTIVLVSGFLAQIYINSAVEIWWGGAGFGARRFANSALVFAVGLASMLELMRRRPVVAPTLIAGALVAANAAFMLDVKNGTLPADQGITFDRMMGAVYTRVGNPFSFPMNAGVAFGYDVGLPAYDRLAGRTYNNLSIDLGEPEDQMFLGPGWSGAEAAPDFSFRWAVGRESIVIAPLKEVDNYRLELRCGPFAYPGSPSPQEVEVLTNGRPAGRISMDKGLSHYAVEVPAALLRPNLNQFLFRYHYVMSPAAVGLSKDERELAMQCDWLRLTRLLTYDAAK
jgi:hypothetical protein